MTVKKFGKFDLKVFINKLDSSEHYAITKGRFLKNRSVRVRVISTNILKNITNFKKNIFNKHQYDLKNSEIQKNKIRKKYRSFEVQKYGSIKMNGGLMILLSQF